MKTDSNYFPHPFWPELGPDFYDAVQPATFPKAILRYRNQAWAQRVGLGSLSAKDWQQAFWAFKPLPKNLSEPLALRYHGHQFMHYNPDLGDGRGFLYAQLIDGPTKRGLDLATKGSGQTPWSRRGDGRLTLKGAMREALATGMLEALGVDTSKTFSIFETGEELERGDEPSPTRSAVLTRLSHGHVRFGTFQRLAFIKDKGAMEKLFSFCLRHYFPTVDAQDPHAVLEFFKAVAANVAKTTARQMLSGFVHGVLNTDNINITGESFDYGPYRFIPYYDIHFTAAYFDRNGLYAYGQQPRILMWNLEQLKLSLQLIAPADMDFTPGFAAYQEHFSSETFRFFLKRLNLKSTDSQLEEKNTETLFLAWVHFMETSHVPFEAFFFDWYGGAEREPTAINSERRDFYRGDAFARFFAELKKFSPINTEILRDAYFQTQEPVHLHIDEIERIWSRIDKDDDWSAFEKKQADFERIKNLYSSF
jgi:uncharacterized protein YdiU (UPF0061 family)